MSRNTPAQLSDRGGESPSEIYIDTILRAEEEFDTNWSPDDADRFVRCLGGLVGEERRVVLESLLSKEQQRRDGTVILEELRRVIPVGDHPLLDDWHCKVQRERARAIVPETYGDWDACQAVRANSHALALVPVAGESSDGVLRSLTSFEKVRLLGEGNFGKVYSAWDPGLRRMVAIKFPSIAQFQRLGFTAEQAIDRFKSEARTLATLRHPGVVTLYDLGYDQAAGGYFAVMEFVEGKSLEDVLKSRQLSFEETARIVYEVAEAVGYFHDHQVFHRDLKPGNLVLDGLGKARVLDFGLAVANGRSAVGEFAGTPHYMAPEQVRAENIGRWADIWAIGAILYELITGQRAFEDDNLEKMLEKIQHDPPRKPKEINPKIPLDLERICLTALNKCPADRYNRAAELARDLAAWRDALPHALDDSSWGEQLAILQKVRPGPRVENSGALEKIIECCATTHRIYPRSTALIERAARLLKTVDDRAMVIASHKLPGETATAYDFWIAAFRESRLHGPRMLASLLLVVENTLDEAGKSYCEETLSELAV